MAEPKKTSEAGREGTPGRLGERTVLESPLSVIKMDVTELRNYANRLNAFMKTPESAALKICECCINVD